MTTRVSIEGAHWLDDAAAASWARMRDAGMPSGGITEAGRTYERQAYLYAQYLAGKLPAYAARPGTSNHESGRAVDMSTTSRAHAWLIAHGAAHGWSRPLLHAAKPEPWHWEYDVTRDQHLIDGATGAPAPIDPWEDDDMLSDDAVQQVRKAVLDQMTLVMRSPEFTKVVRAAVADTPLGEVGRASDAWRDARQIARRTEQKVEALAATLTDTTQEAS